MCNICNKKLGQYIFKCATSGLYLTSYSGLTDRTDHPDMVRMFHLSDAFTIMIGFYSIRPVVITHMRHVIEFFTYKNVVFNSSLVKDQTRYRKWVLSPGNGTCFSEISKEEYLNARREYIELYNKNLNAGK